MLGQRVRMLGGPLRTSEGAFSAAARPDEGPPRVNKRPIVDRGSRVEARERAVVWSYATTPLITPVDAWAQ
jgi:hypothetical protein